jgi:Cu/Ag efflux protein CusF
MLSVLAAAAILGAANLAYAAEATGTIKSIDMSKHEVTLNNGSTYDVAKSVKLDGLKVGEEVRLTYSQSGKAMEVTAIKPAA